MTNDECVDRLLNRYSLNKPNLLQNAKPLRRMLEVLNERELSEMHQYSCFWMVRDSWAMLCPGPPGFSKRIFVVTNRERADGPWLHRGCFEVKSGIEISKSVALMDLPLALVLFIKRIKDQPIPLELTYIDHGSPDHIRDVLVTAFAGEVPPVPPVGTI